MNEASIGCRSTLNFPVKFCSIHQEGVEVAFCGVDGADEHFLLGGHVDEAIRGRQDTGHS